MKIGFLELFSFVWYSIGSIHGPLGFFQGFFEQGIYMGNILLFLKIDKFKLSKMISILTKRHRISLYFLKNLSFQNHDGKEGYQVILGPEIPN